MISAIRPGHSGTPSLLCFGFQFSSFIPLLQFWSVVLDPRTIVLVAALGHCFLGLASCFAFLALEPRSLDPLFMVVLFHSWSLFLESRFLALDLETKSLSLGSLGFGFWLIVLGPWIMVLGPWFLALVCGPRTLVLWVFVRYLDSWLAHTSWSLSLGYLFWILNLGPSSLGFWSWLIVLGPGVLVPWVFWFESWS